MKQILENRYEIDFKSGIIGEGEFKKAYKVYDTYLEKFAVLLIEKNYSKYEMLTIKELSNYNNILNHPNILTYNNIIKISLDGEIFDGAIVEYSDIGSIENLKNYDVSIKDITKIFIDVLMALKYIHENGIIHRDIKPANILIFKNFDGSYNARLSDWSASVFKNSEKKSPIVGTPAFMDPELLKSGISRIENDIWSFAAVVYNFFTGEILYSSNFKEFFKTANENVKLNTSTIPSPFDELVRKVLLVDIENRPTSSELILMLESTQVSDKFPRFFPKTDISDFKTMLLSRASLPDIEDITSVNRWIEEYSREKIKVLFLAANPTTSPLSLDREIKKISTAIKMSKQRDKFILHSAHAVSPDSLIQEILDFEPNIVHFSGHGSVDGIVLESNEESELLVTEKALKRLFGLFKNTIDCVLLNSCYSINQANAINEIIPYVIGMSKSIPDLTAISFSAGFYKGLGNGKNIKFSYELGLANIELEGYSGVEIPELLNKT